MIQQMNMAKYTGKTAYSIPPYSSPDRTAAAVGALIAGESKSAKPGRPLGVDRPTPGSPAQRALR